MLKAQYDKSKMKIEILDNGIIKTTYDLLNPLHCSRCAYPGIEESDCWHHSNDYMDKTLAFGVYYKKSDERSKNSNLTQDILKFKKHSSLADQLSTTLAFAVNVIYPEISGFDYITSVPRHDSELKLDYDTLNNVNPQEILAKVTSQKTNIKYADFILKNTPYSQRYKKEIDRAEISRDFRNYLSMNPKCPIPIHGKDIIIIDDVRTTGNTGSACAKILKGAGARQVYLLVLGRDVFS